MFNGRRGRATDGLYHIVDKKQIREWTWNRSEIKRDEVDNGLKCVFI